jgi:hypothetical protein
MAIVVKIKPTKISAKSKSEILRKLEGDFRNGFIRHYGFGLLGRSGGNHEGVVRLYSLEKHNRKVQVTKRTITRGKRKGEVEVTRTVVRESGWVAHFYDLPRDIVAVSGTRQNTRNFTLKLKG